MRWAKHVARVGEIRHASSFWLENLKGRGHFEDLGLDWRIILEYRVGRCGLDESDSG
jgi:hypothetical protein